MPKKTKKYSRKAGKSIKRLRPIFKLNLTPSAEQEEAYRERQRLEQSSRSMEFVVPGDMSDDDVF